MNEEIKKCIEARTSFFDEYYTIPDDLKSEVNSFIVEIKELGNGCKDVHEFEERFISTGLSEKFNEILPKCIPKPVKMTKQQKKQSVKITANILKTNKNEIINDSLNRVSQNTFNKIKDDAIDRNRKRMIANDTFDDYARSSNGLNNGGLLFGFVKKIFKKNK